MCLACVDAAHSFQIVLYHVHVHMELWVAIVILIYYYCFIKLQSEVY